MNAKARAQGKRRIIHGQPSWRLASAQVEAFVTEMGGHLGPVTFERKGRRLQPYSVAPWAEEPTDPALPPILKALRGDFFCLPFGGNETPFGKERHPVHGETANARWRFRSLESRAGRTCLHVSLTTKVRPGRVDKRIWLLDGQNTVYSQHVVSAMNGPMNLGHHAMLKFPDEPGSLAALPGKEVDTAIMQMLANGAPARRLTAMDLIVRRRMTAAIPALFDAARDPDARLRVAAVKKLGELAGPDQLSGLFDLLAKASDPEDLEAAEQTLSAVCLKAADPGACVGQVEARLAQAQPAQKCALLRVLGAVGGAKALQAVRAAVNDSNAEVHAAAIRTLGSWSAVDAADDLLGLAKTADSPADKMICLRGYLRLAGQGELPLDKRLAMCRQAAPLAQKDDEKKLLLAALGSIASVEALDAITPYLDDAATKEEAAASAVDISDKLLKEKDSAKAAPKLIEPLEKAAQATANADLAKRAKDLCDQAKSKAGTK